MARKRPSSRGTFVLVWTHVLRALLLLAIVAQGTIVQTHIDVVRPAALQSIAGEATQLSKAGASGPVDGSALCPLCQEAAMAGHYFLPAANALPAAPSLFEWSIPAAMLAFGLATSAHGWLSRAPPR